MTATNMCSNFGSKCCSPPVVEVWVWSDVGLTSWSVGKQVVLSKTIASNRLTSLVGYVTSVQKEHNLGEGDGKLPNTSPQN